MEGGQQGKRPIDMSGPELIPIGRKEGRISSAMHHRFDRVAQVADQRRGQALLGICQISLDNLQLASVSEAANGLQNSRVSREVFSGTCYGDHRATSGQQMTQHLSADKTCSSGD